MKEINNSIDRLDVAFRQRIGNKEYNDILGRGISFFEYRFGATNLNGKTGLKAIHAILCATKKLPERLSSINDAIRYANKQIDDQIPGMVSIGISDLMTNMFPFDFQQAAVLANDVLQENPKISSVLFTSEEYDEDTLLYRFGVQMMKNNNAQFKLPSKYDDLISL